MGSIRNTGEVRLFVSELKDWATKNGEVAFLDAIGKAEEKGFTGPELIHQYVNLFKEYRTKLPAGLPSDYRDSWDAALEVSEESLTL